MAMTHASYALVVLLALTGSAWAGQAPRPAVIAFEDGGQATYHVLESGEPRALDTLVFETGVRVHFPELAQAVHVLAGWHPGKSAL